MRETAGRLSGHALGQAPEPEGRPSYNLLDDLAAVWPHGETAAWNETLCARLAELRPDTYDGWKSEQLTTALKAIKPEPVRVTDVGRRIDGKAVTRRGIRRDDLTTAITERNRLRGNG
jgi:S-DNA-T family DNA segregation ATPase FtsK/SpoIIIE